jgi:hypothetical protein
MWCHELADQIAMREVQLDSCEASLSRPYCCICKEAMTPAILHAEEHAVSSQAIGVAMLLYSQ